MNLSMEQPVSNRRPPLLARIRDRITGMEWYDQVVFRKRVLFESDRSVIERDFRARFGRSPDLDQPQTFNEKLLWLSLNYRLPLYSTLADKYEVRAYVRDRVGDAYLNTLLGVYERVEEIRWDALPDAFALKATHGSKWNVICPDRCKLDRKQAEYDLARWLRHNFYWYGREWIYRDLKPRIVAEAFLDDGGKPPPDFKIFCFDGEPRLIQVDADRFEEHTRNFFSPDWTLLPARMIYPPIPRPVPRPANLDDMVRVARALARGMPFVRVDLYDVGGRVVFGEMSFYPERGMGPFDDPLFNREVGSWIRLPAPHPDRGWWSRQHAVWG